MRTRQTSEIADPGRRALVRKRATGLAFAAVLAAGLGGAARFAQERNALQVPDGLAFTEFKGYESWQVVAVSEAEATFAVILGNPAMIEAYRAGIPADGTHFPDGAKMAKVHWSKRMSPDAPSPTIIPGTLRDVDFMVKDSKRFPDAGGWGYAVFAYDSVEARFKPEGTGANCGASCHTLAAAKDQVFTEFPAR